MVAAIAIGIVVGVAVGTVDGVVVARQIDAAMVTSLRRRQIWLRAVVHSCSAAIQAVCRCL